jgi:hypothetical protein
MLLYQTTRRHIPYSRPWGSPVSHSLSLCSWKYSLRPTGSQQCSVYILNTSNICWLMSFQITLVTSFLGAKFKRKPHAIYLCPIDLNSGRQSIAECHLFYWRWYAGLPALVHSCRTDSVIQTAVGTLFAVRSTVIFKMCLINFFFPMARQPLGGLGHLIFRGFTITLFRHATLGRTPLDEGPARRRDLYLTTHNTHKRQTSIPPVGFFFCINSWVFPFDPFVLLKSFLSCMSPYVSCYRPYI